MNNPGQPTAVDDFQAPPHKEFFADQQGMVDDDSWIVGRVLISRHAEEPPEKCWRDPLVGCFYTVREAPDRLPPLQPILEKSPINQYVSYYDGGEWEIGKSILSVNKVEEGAKRTPHHKTLEALKKRSREESWDFETPEVYYHGCHDGYYYILYSTSAGAQLRHAWLLKYDDNEWKNKVMSDVAQVCKVLAEWYGDTMSGVDGKELVEPYLSDQPGLRGSFTSQELLATCQEIGFDCSTLVFAHNVLSPDLIKVDIWGRVTGFQNWSGAGFVPKDWIRTKFAWGTPFHGDRHAWNEEQRREWAVGLDRELKKLGFGHRLPQFMSWDEAQCKKKEEAENARKEKEEKGEIEEQQPKICGTRLFEFDGLLEHLLHE
ncbi:hypothetical protein ACJ41O_005358 [Fusarium nematophilum]